MRARRVELLAAELDDAYRLIRDRVDGLSDDEFWWEPVADAWTVRPTGRGTWAADYEDPDPDPAPFTTIGWRVVHVAECKRMYHEYAFGGARLMWPDLDSPHSAATAVAWRIFWTMINHDLWHGGEVGALRDLYRVADPPGMLPAQRRVGRIRPHR